jgi:hypothetical protein
MCITTKTIGDGEDAKLITRQAMENRARPLHTVQASAAGMTAIQAVIVKTIRRECQRLLST